MFRNRIDAGQQLAKLLVAYKNHEDAVVVALPRGGVVTGYVIARELGLPLEVSMVKKLGHPRHSEYAIGAVDVKGTVINGMEGISPEYIKRASREIQAMLIERYKMYRGDVTPIKLTDKMVIVVDDGVATGRTMIASLQLIRKERPKEIIVAVPVSPAETIKRLKTLADSVVCLEIPAHFYAVGAHYGNFEPVSDETVKELLNKSPIYNS
jgi:predicted phosphoribosyltransferase